MTSLPLSFSFRMTYSIRRRKRRASACPRSTTLADRFQASVTATGSRYAAVVSSPVDLCSREQGKVRYASRSKPLKDAPAWIPPRLDIPEGSLSKKVRAGLTAESQDTVDADLWFSEWERGGTLVEEVRHLAQWDQTLSLLWFEDLEIPGVRSETSVAGFMRKKPKRMRYCRNWMANCDGQESSDDASSGGGCWIHSIPPPVSTLCRH